MAVNPVDYNGILQALAFALSTGEVAGDEPLHLEAEPEVRQRFDVPLSSASGDLALAIERLDGRDLSETADGLALVERLERAEPVIAAVETLLGLEFSPADHGMAQMAAALRVTARGADGEARHVLHLGLSPAFLDALPRRENVPEALRHSLPVLVDVIVGLPPAAADLAEGDLLLLGGAAEASAMVEGPDALGAFAVDLDIGTQRIASAGQPGALQLRFPDSRFTLHALNAAKRGAPLTLPQGLGGMLQAAGGDARAAQIVTVGDAIAVRIDSVLGKAA
ncbi:MAG: hypothetical protein WA979_12715 [Pacificimonas sp.]